MKSFLFKINLSLLLIFVASFSFAQTAKEIKFKNTYSIIIKFDTKDKIGSQEREVIIQFVSDSMNPRSIDKKLVFKGVVKASKKTKKL